jgi:hypothetical protein
MKCKICKKQIKENTDGNFNYCQGHNIFEVSEKKPKIDQGTIEAMKIDAFLKWGVDYK